MAFLDHGITGDIEANHEGCKHYGPGKPIMVETDRVFGATQLCLAMGELRLGSLFVCLLVTARVVLDEINLL